MDKYLSIDIGGTAIKYGIITEECRIYERDKIPTEAYRGGEGIKNKVFGIIESFIASHDIRGICISTAGIVDIKNGIIEYSGPTIPNYTGVNWKKELKERFAISCEVENDVNCAGLAEYRSGAAKGIGSILCLTVGTGIGGCIILDGKILRGRSNSACEIGYMHMMGSDFQTLGAASILSQKVANRKGDSMKAWSGRLIFEEAKKGDQVCRRAIDEMIDILGMGIANICYVVNPEMVVLGGGIMEQRDYIEERLYTSFNKYSLPVISDKLQLAFAQHKNDAGMIGAYYHYMQMQ